MLGHVRTVCHSSRPIFPSRRRARGAGLSPFLPWLPLLPFLGTVPAGVTRGLTRFGCVFPERGLVSWPCLCFWSSVSKSLLHFHGWFVSVVGLRFVYYSGHQAPRCAT